MVSQKLIVYQHDSDEQIKKTHCHILIEECSIGVEGLKKRVQSFNLKGNQDWSFRPEGYENDIDKYLTYMSKGKIAPAFNKGYEPSRLETVRGNWVEHKSPAKETPASEASARVQKDSLSDLYQTYCDEILENVSSMGLHLTIRDFRSASIAFWRKRNGGLLPQTSTYKRFITSVFLEYRDLKRLPICEETLNEIELRYA